MMITLCCYTTLCCYKFDIQQLRKCSRFQHELNVKPFFRESPVLIRQWFQYGHNCKLTRKGIPENLPSYLNIKGENLFCIIDEELSKR